MSYPGSTSRVLADLIPGVIDALQGRSDVSNIMAARFLRRAIQEVTASHPFEELRATGPRVNLSTGTSVYQVNFFLNNNDDITLLEEIVLFIDFPNNTVDQVLKYKTPQGIEMMMPSATSGTPAWWTRFGSNVHFGPNPDKGYAVFVRYQVRHPFPQDTNALPGATLYMPEDWDEIVEYEAASRICIAKRWNDQYDVIHKILYGDPESMLPTGKMARPGLYAARLMQVERDQQFSSRNLGIIVGRYSAR